MNIEKERQNKTRVIINDISVSKGTTQILEDVSLNIQDGEHVALIGPNGAGKTTLLNVIAGRELIDEGEVVVPSNTSIAYVPQTVDTVFEEVGDLNLHNYLLYSRNLLGVCERIKEIEEMLERKLPNQEIDILLKEYGNLQESYEIRGGYDLEYRAEMIFDGLGFSDNITLDTKLTELSAGQRAKLFLVQVLISDANLLLLDEPSNYLDQESSLWLAEYLRESEKSVIVISHDPDFLNIFTNKVLLLDKFEPGIKTFIGDYTEYLEQYERVNIARQREIEKKQKEIERLKEMSNRFRAGVNSKKAKDREKKIAKIKENLPEYHKKKNNSIPGFKVEYPSEQEVLIVEDLIKIYPRVTLDYSGFSLKLYRGEKVAITGDIGSGKTTFLKMIAGELKQDRGDILFGNKVNIGYYSEEVSDFDESLSVIGETSRTNRTMSEQELRNHLVTFLFRGEEVFKRVSVLSYGERSRLMLAKLATKGHNLLLLDEPTNHLDLELKKNLIDMLRNYQGTLLLTSHDSEFLDEIGLDRIVPLKVRQQ